MYRSKIIYILGMLLTVITLSACSTGATDSPTLSSIAVTPANPSIATTATQQFTATGTYSDNTTKDITSTVTWTSGTTTVATIATSGLATGIAAGTSVITATLGAISGTTTLTVTASTIDVYVTGYRLDGSDSYAPIWKNGVKLYDLTDTTHNVTTNSIYVSAGSVYVAGYYYDGGSIPAFWKDESAPVALTTSNSGMANSVYVSGNNVYVTGWYKDNDDNVAAVWVSSNGGTSFNDPTILPATGNNTLANSIYVSGSDVYVAGSYRDSGDVDVAVVWISSDGGSSFAKTDLPGQGQGIDQASANSVYVSGSNVYIAGSYYNGVNTIATVWISSDGGTTFNKIDLTGLDAVAYSVYVSGGSVYVAGYYTSGTDVVTAAVWVSSNGGASFNIPTDLITGENVNANSICVSGNNVYVAGYYNDSFNNIATVWVSSDAGSSFVKNDLTVTGNNASATSIYLDVH